MDESACKILFVDKVAWEKVSASRQIDHVSDTSGLNPNGERPVEAKQLSEGELHFVQIGG